MHRSAQILSEWCLNFKNKVPPFYRPGKMRVIFLTFCHYLLNGISFFAFMGHFWKMPLKTKFPLSPDYMAVWSEEECDDSSSFFPTSQHQTLFCFFGRALYRLGKWEVFVLSQGSGDVSNKSEIQMNFCDRGRLDTYMEYQKINTRKKSIEGYVRK